MPRILISWSSGKDSAWTLHRLRQQPENEIAGLLTTVNAEFDRVAMHGTRRAVLEAQAKAAGIPLWVVPLPWPCSNEVYGRLMSEAMRRAVDEQIDAVAFGDLFLRDIRAYRERQLEPVGIEPLFPLWDLATDSLAREMVDLGLRAKLVCIDQKKLPASFAGRDFELELLRELPAGTIRAANAASSTPVFTTVPCSGNRSILRRARSWNAMASSLPTSSRGRPPAAWAAGTAHRR